MTQNKGVRWTDKEDDFIRASYLTNNNGQICDYLFKIFKSRRTPASISMRIKTLSLSGRPRGGKRPKKAAANDASANKTSPLVYVPKGDIAIKSDAIVRALTNSDTSLYDIEKIVSLDITSLRALMREGGIPKPYDNAIREFFNKRGVRV